MTLERLGESEAFGEVLLETLEACGWFIYRRRGFAGEGILLVAQLGELEQRAGGPTLAAAAAGLFQEIATYWPGAVGPEELQLQLFEIAS